MLNKYSDSRGITCPYKVFLCALKQPQEIPNRGLVIAQIYVLAHVAIECDTNLLLPDYLHTSALVSLRCQAPNVNDLRRLRMPGILFWLGGEEWKRENLDEFATRDPSLCGLNTNGFRHSTAFLNILNCISLCILCAGYTTFSTRRTRLKLKTTFRSNF